MNSSAVKDSFYWPGLILAVFACCVWGYYQQEPVAAIIARGVVAAVIYVAAKMAMRRLRARR